MSLGQTWRIAVSVSYSLFKPEISGACLSAVVLILIAVLGIHPRCCYVVAERCNAVHGWALNDSQTLNTTSVKSGADRIPRCTC